MSPLRSAALVLACSLALTGCLGQDGKDSVGSDKSPDEVMQLAKETLDETSGVEISLEADDLPGGIDGIALVSADGTAMHPSSFEGKITGSLSGITQDGKVIAIDGTVWVDITFLTSGFDEVDPADYSAPDPSQLIATEGGLSDLLVQTTDLEQGHDVRGGEDNDEVLTEYTGKLDAELVELIVPTASGDSFDVTYQINSDGELRSMSITGQFYPDTDSMTYDLDLSNYGADKDISAP